MIIRQETLADHAAIDRVIREAFAAAPHRSGTEVAIVHALREAGAISYGLVAEGEEGVAGFVAFSPVEIEGMPGGWFALGPLAVSPDRQRQGIGGALIRRGLAWLKDRGASGCVVLGDPDYYRRFGFRSDGRLSFRDVPTGYLMSIRFSGEDPTGEVRFHAGFDAP